MLHSLLGTVAGFGLSEIVLRALLRRYRLTWWGNISYVMVFLTLGLAVSEVVAVGSFQGYGRWFLVACLLCVPSVLGLRRK
jgi:hypothetical protein